MKKVAIIGLLAALLLAFTACGDRTYTHAYYEFFCESEMTVTRLPDSESTTLSAEEIDTLLRIRGNPREGGKVKGNFDYAFARENTTIRYCSDNGVFQIGDDGAKMKLSHDDRKSVETILDQYR